jgi:TonB family protein
MPNSKWHKSVVTGVTFATYSIGRRLTKMTTLPKRPSFLAALMALGLIILHPPLSAAQEQPESKRKITSQVSPSYPELASKMQIHGTVRVEAVVLPNGKVKSTQVVGGSPVLVKAAVDAIEKWRWQPAPQETKELIELNFHP